MEAIETSGVSKHAFVSKFSQGHAPIYLTAIQTRLTWIFSKYGPMCTACDPARSARGKVAKFVLSEIYLTVIKS